MSVYLVVARDMHHSSCRIVVSIDLHLGHFTVVLHGVDFLRTASGQKQSVRSAIQSFGRPHKVFSQQQDQQRSGAEESSTVVKSAAVFYCCPSSCLASLCMECFSSGGSAVCQETVCRFSVGDVEQAPVL